jgi:hypothetical protein
MKRELWKPTNMTNMKILQAQFDWACSMALMKMHITVHAVSTECQNHLLIYFFSLFQKLTKPWKAILTSGPVWGIMLANACGNYGAYMLLTQMPTYMKEVLKFDIESASIFRYHSYKKSYQLLKVTFWVACDRDSIVRRRRRRRLHSVVS